MYLMDLTKNKNHMQITYAFTKFLYSRGSFKKSIITFPVSFSRLYFTRMIHSPSLYFKKFEPVILVLTQG